MVVEAGEDFQPPAPNGHGSDGSVATAEIPSLAAIPFSPDGPIASDWESVETRRRKRLYGKTVVLSGGLSGIMRAFVWEMASYKANVVVLDYPGDFRGQTFLTRAQRLACEWSEITTGSSFKDGVVTLDERSKFPQEVPSVAIASMGYMSNVLSDVQDIVGPDGEFRRLSSADITPKEATAPKPKLLILPCDVSKEEQVQNSIAETVSRVGRIDRLVLGAGIAGDNFVTKMRTSDWDKVYAVNGRGAFLQVSHAWQFMRQGEPGSSRIVGIGSVSGFRGTLGQLNYVFTKAGVAGMMLTGSNEGQRFGIEWVCLAPGYTDTPMVQGIPDKAREKTLAELPTHRFIPVEDMAEALVFCVAQPGLNGTVVHVNDGLWKSI